MQRGVDGFPRDEYTPFGLLANPYAVARSWEEGSGGVIRSSREGVGFGWVYPWALGAEAGAELRVSVYRADDRPTDRHHVAPDGLVATHHSARLFEYSWRAVGYRWEARYVLVGEHELGVEVAATRLDAAGRSRGSTGEEIGAAAVVALDVVGWRKGDVEGSDGAGAEPGSLQPGGAIDLVEPYGRHELVAARSSGEPAAREDGTHTRTGRRPVGPRDRRSAGGVTVPLPPDHRDGVVARAILRRVGGSVGTPGATESRTASEEPEQIGGRVAEAVERARAEDDAIWRGGARLIGDWPQAWRRGWVYDLETTRMCVSPPGGIFTDVWPSWMVQWPRVVVAEGTLDMARLAYLAPDLAKRAVLSLFRDAPAPNVPCVFGHGEPNMVAADGSVCGTSPAWCVPFYNVERLYLLTADDAWLARLYPYLARYLDWWLAERTDAEGWAVYKCTWEAGEDDTPRLDPERRGDNVVSEFVRPVELQATMALSSATLARFADVLGRSEDAARWRSVADPFAERTRSLWDPEAGRFRDWDARAGRFLEASGEANYWGVDPCRFSALAFTPVLAGLTDREQLGALAREVELYDRPPWTLWASWSYVILEAALAAGWRPFAARVAADIVGRVYDELDRRTVAGNEPTPGAAREYWPLDLSAWRSCEGYGWGATTASFLARQIFGFLEGGYPTQAGDTTAGDATDGESDAAADPVLTFRLVPGLPSELLVPGRRYALANMPYRGAHVSVEYAVERADAGTSGDADLVVTITTVPRTSGCRVIGERGGPVSVTRESGGAHRFSVRNGDLCVVALGSA